MSQNPEPQAFVYDPANPVSVAKARVIVEAIVNECQLAKAAIGTLNDAGVAAEQLLLAAPLPEDVSTEVLAMYGNLAALDPAVPHLVALVVQQFASLLEGTVTVGGVDITKKRLLLIAASVV